MSPAEKVIDLRSDTVTRPTPEMYSAMVKAPLGDDVFEDDPTVHALEQAIARLLGKEAALFLPSGTMANSIGIALACRPGDEAIMLADSHIFLFEGGGCARLWGVQARTVPGERGAPTVEEVEGAIRGDDPHFPRTSLVCVENTHNMQGGVVVAPERLRAIGELCQRRGLRLHLDGARLLNAAVASKHPPADFTAHASTVSLALSKGLGCPVGSILACSTKDRAEARRIRKVLGGGMRQAGVLAACGLVALENYETVLSADHRRAHRLADAIASLPRCTVTPTPVATNILFFEVAGYGADDYRRLVASLKERSILAVNIFDRRIRLVTHRDIDDAAIGRAIDILSSLVRA